MRTVLLLTIVSISLAMAGCKGSYAEMAMRSPDEIAKLPDDQLVAVYANERGRWGENEKFRREITKRGLFTPEEWDRIDRKTFRLGDKEEVVWAAWGTPDDVSTLRTGDGVSKVLVYGDRADNRVYILNGRVSALGQ